MKLELRRGLIYVPITLLYAHQEVHLHALVDTGSAGTAADINRFHIDYQREARICDLVGIGGRQQVIVQEVETVRLGDASCANFPIEFCDMDGAYGIEAIVGGDLLDRLHAVIDYPNRWLQVSE